MFKKHVGLSSTKSGENFAKVGMEKKNFVKYGGN